MVKPNNSNMIDIRNPNQQITEMHMVVPWANRFGNNSLVYDLWACSASFDRLAGKFWPSRSPTAD